MSIRDYSKKYVVINGTTNEQIVVPPLSSDLINVNICLNDFVLLKTIKDELRDCEGISVLKTYMKD